jgi:hypothetical protein
MNGMAVVRRLVVISVPVREGFKTVGHRNVTVEVSVDMEALALVLGPRAESNKSRVAKIAGGFVKVAVAAESR